jgi:hypothetical protein
VIHSILPLGPRWKPTQKHLHYDCNLKVVCRALNLAQIQAWVDWIILCWGKTEVFAVELPEFEVEDETQDSDEDIE